MTPIGNVVVFTVVAGVLTLVAKRLPRANRPRVIWFTLLTTSGLTAAMYVPRLHPVALLILVLGVSAVVTNSLVESGWAVRAVRPVTIALSIVTIAFAIPMAVWPLVQETRDVGRLGPAPPAAPNVLVLILDTVRAASLDLYGHLRPTSPNLTELARGGVTVDRAISPASYTLPTHASLFTGRWPHELSATWRTPLDGEAPTLGEVLTTAGYRTGAFSANRIFVTREWGLGRGFAHFEEHRLGLQQVVRSTALLRTVANSAPFRRLFRFNDQLARVDAAANNRALVRWLERDRERPYFAFVNFFDAHAPFLPADSLATRFGWYDEGATATERREARERAQLEPEDLGPVAGTAMERAYEGAIAGLDGAVADLMRDLRARGMLENTIVVIASDHGEEFGEHGLYNHGNSLYMRSLHVPLVMVYPGVIPPGLRVTQSVSLLDVAATIVDLAGVQGGLPGESLRAMWDPSHSRASGPAFAEIRYDPLASSWVRAATGDMISIIDSSVQVIRYGDGSIEAFDIEFDMSGLTRADTTRETVRTLRSWLPPLTR
jgi:arylsulfatase A-like enzyme